MVIPHTHTQYCLFQKWMMLMIVFVIICITPNLIYLSLSWEWMYSYNNNIWDLICCFFLLLLSGFFRTTFSSELFILMIFLKILTDFVLYSYSYRSMHAYQSVFIAHHNGQVLDPSLIKSSRLPLLHTTAQNYYSNIGKPSKQAGKTFHLALIQ